MESKERVRKIFATVLLIAVLAIVIYALLPYFNALFGAVLLYFLFRPVYMWIHKKKISKNWSAVWTIVLSLLILIIPLSFAATLVVQEIAQGIADQSQIISRLQGIDELLPFVDLTSFSDQLLNFLINFVRTSLVATIGNVTRLILQLTITYFVFYFMLIDSENLNKKIMKFLPFNKKNSERLVQQFNNVTHSTVVTSGLIALMQGTMLGLGFWILGFKGAIFWGFIAFLISLLPVVGVPLIWVPTAVIQFVAGNTFPAVAIFIWGAIISSVDNFIRPYIQKRVGQIHPLITIVGVLSGISVFGILGIVIGPLLLSYAISITQMYIEEFV